MTVGSAETDFLTVQVYNGIPDADFTETDALTDGFTVSGQRQCIQVRMFCIPECEVGSRNVMLSPLEIPSATMQPQAAVSL